MPDYKEMHLKMVRASEKAVRQMEAAPAELIAAQRECEEMYLAAPEPELKVVELSSGEGSTPRRGGSACGRVTFPPREK